MLPILQSSTVFMYKSLRMPGNLYLFKEYLFFSSAKDKKLRIPLSIIKNVEKKDDFPERKLMLKVTKNDLSLCFLVWNTDIWINKIMGQLKASYAENLEEEENLCYQKD